MSYSQMINILRQKHKEEILLINAGAFYIAIEEDAVLLNNKLKLKCSCFQKNTCKVGVPINSLEKYLEKIQKLGYSYIVYNFNKKEQELKLIKKYEGKKNRTKRKNINCLMCKGITSKEAKKYLAGHLGYIKIANTYNLEKKLFE